MSDRAPGARHVLIVDDHPMFRRGARFVVEDAGFVVGGEASTVREATTMIAAGRGDVVLLDLSLGTESGLALMGAIRSRGIPAVVCSLHGDRLHVEQALTAGVAGYVTKDEPAEVLARALRTVLRGQSFLSARAAACLSDSPEPSVSLGRPVQCSHRESEVLEFLAAGYGVSEIAARLDVSVRTVEAYCLRLTNKLGLSGMKELHRYAVGTRSAN